MSLRLGWMRVWSWVWCGASREPLAPVDAWVCLDVWEGRGASS